MSPVIARLRAWLEGFVRADSPMSMTRAMMAAFSLAAVGVGTAGNLLLVAVAWRVVRGDPHPADVSANLYGAAALVGALAAGAWGQARERTISPPGTSPNGPAPRQTTQVGQEPG